MAASLPTSMVWSGHAQEKMKWTCLVNGHSRRRECHGTSGEVHWTYVTAIACRKASFCRELQDDYKIGYNLLTATWIG